MITQARLKELFDYGEDEEGAYFERLIRAGKRGKVGDKVRGTQAAVYVIIRIDGMNRRFHRMVWLWHNPTIPDELDHIDITPSNNRYANLRQCTTAENARNRRSYKDATGVTRRNTGWEAAITLERQWLYIGIYPTKGEAITARAEFKANLLKTERDF